MKIFSCDQIRKIDRYTIKNEPVESWALMERASQACCDWILKHSDSDSFHIYTGTGNNGGDGLAIARLLAQKHKNIKVFLVKFSENFSPDCKENLQKLKDKNIEVEDFRKKTTKEENAICIDAVFGSGLNRPAEGTALEAIRHINTYQQIISIDIPSGLFGENNSINDPNKIVKANSTLTFQFPKLAFMLPKFGTYAGDIHILNIKLHPDIIAKETSDYNFTTKESIKHLIPPRNKFSHKGNFGHSLLFAGSKGKSGAAILASKSCLRSGCGLLSILSDKSCLIPLQTAIPEAMVTSHEELNAEYSAIGIGPGIGTQTIQTEIIKDILQNYNCPMVIDADGLNMLSKDKLLLEKLPPNSIITPHPKEFERLFGTFASDEERLEQQKEFSKKLNLIILLKGRYTCITLPNGEAHFNSTGNPGMATAGSGDCLTGIILALLSQKISPEHSAIIGALIHGLAGDFAAKKIGELSTIASDIIKNIPEAFKSIY